MLCAVILFVYFLPFFWCGVKNLQYSRYGHYRRMYACILMDIYMRRCFTVHNVYLMKTQKRLLVFVICLTCEYIESQLHKSTQFTCQLLVYSGVKSQESSEFLGGRSVFLFLKGKWDGTAVLQVMIWNLNKSI